MRLKRILGVALITLGLFMFSGCEMLGIGIDYKDFEKNCETTILEVKYPDGFTRTTGLGVHEGLVQFDHFFDGQILVEVIAKEYTHDKATIEDVIENEKLLNKQFAAKEYSESIENKNIEGKEYTVLKQSYTDKEDLMYVVFTYVIENKEEYIIFSVLGDALTELRSEKICEEVIKGFKLKKNKDIPNKKDFNQVVYGKDYTISIPKEWQVDGEQVQSGVCYSYLVNNEYISFYIDSGNKEEYKGEATIDGIINEVKNSERSGYKIKEIVKEDNFTTKTGEKGKYIILNEDGADGYKYFYLAAVIEKGNKLYIVDVIKSRGYYNEKVDGYLLDIIKTLQPTDGEEKPEGVI